METHRCTHSTESSAPQERSGWRWSGPEVLLSQPWPQHSGVRQGLSIRGPPPATHVAPVTGDDWTAPPCLPPWGSGHRQHQCHLILLTSVCPSHLHLSVWPPKHSCPNSLMVCFELRFMKSPSVSAVSQPPRPIMCVCLCVSVPVQFKAWIGCETHKGQNPGPDTQLCDLVKNHPTFRILSFLSFKLVAKNHSQ